MTKAITSAKKPRGRPPVGATPVNVRFPPGELAALDSWREAQDDKPGRPEAVRRLVAKSLDTGSKEAGEKA